MKGFSQLGQSVAKTGAAIAKAPMESQKIKMLYQRFENLDKAKQELKSDIIHKAGKNWTSNQILQFSTKIDAIDNVDALIEIGGQFGQAWQYYEANKDDVKIVPGPFQTFEGYREVVAPQIETAKKLKKQKGITSGVGSIMQPQAPPETEPGLRELEGTVGGMPGGLPQGYQPEPQAPPAPTTGTGFHSQLGAPGVLPEGTTVSELKENPQYMAATKSFEEQPKPATEYQRQSQPEHV